MAFGTNGLKKIAHKNVTLNLLMNKILNKRTQKYIVKTVSFRRLTILFYIL